MSANRVSFDELYRRSSQYRIWSFTKEELSVIRQQVNEKGSKRVDQRLEENKDADPSLVSQVTIDEELELISFHLRNTLAKVTALFNMPSQVRATATSFIRKFYLVHSVMEHHPKFIVLTCIFLAAKSENYFIGINTFTNKLKVAPESILSLEFTILESLKFTLLNHHPYRPLYGFFFDIQDTLGAAVSPNELGATYDKARALINEALITDVVYHFTPPQIALACFKATDNDLTTKYLEKKFNRTIVEEPEPEGEDGEEDGDVKKQSEEATRTDYDQLLQVINECQVMLKTAKNPTKERAKEIDRKTQFCLNPSLVMKRKRDGSEEDSNKRPRTELSETPAGTPAP